MTDWVVLPLRYPTVDPLRPTTGPTLWSIRSDPLPHYIYERTHSRPELQWLPPGRASVFSLRIHNVLEEATLSTQYIHAVIESQLLDTSHIDGRFANIDEITFFYGGALSSILYHMYDTNHQIILNLTKWRYHACAFCFCDRRRHSSVPHPTTCGTYLQLPHRCAEFR